ncbi:MAG: hypothetical protein ACM31C_02950 [Acidobacteriota bacterium]
MRWPIVIVLSAACSPSAPTCAEPIAPGELVISELFASYKGGGVAGHQWLELYNTSDRALELAGLELVHVRPDGTTAKHRIGSLAVASHAYATLGDSAPGELAPLLDYGYGDELGTFATGGGGTLALRCGSTEISSLAYGPSAPGHSRELTAAAPPSAALAADPASWCDAITELSPGNFGTPRAPSDCIPAGQCRDAGGVRAIVAPQPGQLVIDELMPSPSRVPDAAGEWLEVVALADVDLNGIALDRIHDALAPDVLAADACVHVAAGDRVVFGKTSGANGGLPPLAGTFRFALVAGSPSAPGDARVLAGGAVIDAVQWTRSTPGAALQLDPRALDALANDDASSWCDATTPYGDGDLGTPGAPNASCPLVPPAGECLEAGVARAIRAPAPGQLAISEVMAHPRAQPYEEWVEVTNLGPTDFDLNALALDRVGDSRSPDAVHATVCKPVPSGGFGLFARSADPATNGGLPAVDATFGLSLVDTAGDVRVLAGESVLDAVTWTTAPAGASMQLVPDRCTAVTPYGDDTNLGTPRAANACF